MAHPHLLFLNLTHDDFSKITEEITTLCIESPWPPVDDTPARGLSLRYLGRNNFALTAYQLQATC